MIKTKSKNLIFILLILSSMVPLLTINFFPNFFLSTTILNILVIMFQLALVTYYFIKINRFRFEKSTFITTIVLFSIAFIVIIFQSFVLNKTVFISDLIDVMSIPLSIVIFILFLMISDYEEEDLYKFHKFIVALGLVASVYNIVANVDQFKLFLTNANVYNINFKSFFTNRNSFGNLLTLSIASGYLLVRKNSNIKTYLVLVFLSFNLILTFSRSSILFLIIFYFIMNFNQHHVKKILYIFIAFVVLMSSASFFSVGRDFIKKYIIRSDYGTASRNHVWKIGLDYIKNTNILFGGGLNNGLPYLKLMGFDLPSFHNLYIEILVIGGAVLGLVYLVLHKKIVQIYYNVYKTNNNLGIFYFAVLISLLVNYFFESLRIFTLGYQGTLLTIYFASVPLLYIRNIIEHKTSDSLELVNDSEGDIQYDK